MEHLLAVSLTRDENWLPIGVEKLAEGQDERWNALILLTARLSQLVPRATAADVERLAAVGLTREQIGDAVLAVAFFSWANRCFTVPQDTATARALEDTIRGVCDLTAQSAFKLGGMMPPDQRDAVNPLRRVQRGFLPC